MADAKIIRTSERRYRRRFEALQKNEYIRYEDLPLKTNNGRLIDVELVTLGVAVSPEHGATSTEILRAVDAALYRAKHEGRSRVVIAR